MAFVRIAVLDSIAVADAGPGKPGYFSSVLIDRLRKDHEVVIGPFSPALCSQADVVWCEWTNEDAFKAARSGLCNRLVLRMRGYDTWFPLEQLPWERVHALVYESEFLKRITEERYPFLASKGRVIPSGVDLKRFKFMPRRHGPVIAMVARAEDLKGFQLIFEWARLEHVAGGRAQLHVTTALGEHNPRLVRYLEHVKPDNVTIHGTVDPATWLDEIDANYIVCASQWETLGYSIAEAMALGIKPLIHDFPAARVQWPGDLIWRSFTDLDALFTRPYETHAYRRFVETELDSDRCTERFMHVLLDGLEERQHASLGGVALHAHPPEVDPYSTHIPILAWAIAHTTGPILELGAGGYSTPLIHALADHREVLTLEDNPQFLARFRDFDSKNHRIEQVVDWASAPALDQEWSLVFVDNKREVRSLCLDRVRDKAEIVVVHDTDKAGHYAMVEALAAYKHSVVCAWFANWTTVLSMIDPLDDLRVLVDGTP